MPENRPQFPLATIDELREAFRDVQFPADQALLLRQTRQSGVDESVVDAVSVLPNRTYDSMEEVIRHMERQSGETGESLSYTYDDPDHESMGQESILRAGRVEEAEEGGGEPGVEHRSGSVRKG